MRVIEHPLAAERIIRDAEERRQQRQPRAPGIHASDLIYCLRKQWLTRQYHLESKGPDVLSVDILTMFLTGHGYHALLEEGNAEVEVELTLANGSTVVCTIDYLHPDSIEPWEVKSTRYSSNKTPEDIAHYVDQVGTYCLAQRSLRGWLVVLFLNGNYSTKRGSVLKVWEVEFTSEELVGWSIELQRRYDILADDSTIPDADFEHYGWECQYCPYGPKGTGVCEGGIGRLTPFFMPDDDMEPVEVIEL
jgi:hypothetical protein